MWLSGLARAAPGNGLDVLSPYDTASRYGPPGSRDGAHPTVDLTTDTRAAMISQRPVVGLSSWLADAIAHAPPTGQVLTLVTPPATRLTLPVRVLVTGGVLQWVVRTPTGSFYDGLFGTALDFDGTDWTPGSTSAAEFEDSPQPQAWQVLVSLTVEHRATIATRLGGAVEILTREITGSGPSGWGPHEPVSEPWNREVLTTVARRRMPSDTQLIAVSSDAAMISTIEAARTDRGVEETVRCWLNAGPLTRPISDVADSVTAALRDVAANETIGFAAAHLRPGQADLTETATRRAAPLPLAILIGPRAVRTIGRQRFSRATLPTANEVGRPRVPGLLMELGRDGADPWAQLIDLVSGLGEERLRAAAPSLADLAQSRPAPDPGLPDAGRG